MGLHKFIHLQPASTGTLWWLSVCLHYSRILGCLFKTLSPESLFDYLATDDALPQVPIRWAVHTPQWRNNRSTILSFYILPFFSAPQYAHAAVMGEVLEGDLVRNLMVRQHLLCENRARGNWYILTWLETDASVNIETCYAALSHTHWPIYFNRARYTEHRLERCFCLMKKTPSIMPAGCEQKTLSSSLLEKVQKRKTWRRRAASSSAQNCFFVFFSFGLILESRLRIWTRDQSDKLWPGSASVTDSCYKEV